MPGKGTTRRSIRIEDELWGAAKSKAEAEGIDLSSIIRGLLMGYLEDRTDPALSGVKRTDLH